jgi:ferredoxin-NADP reductase
MSWLRRPRAGGLIVLGSSALSGAVYRFLQPSTSDASLNPRSFTAYTLIKKQPVSSTSAIFTLQNRDGGPDPVGLKEGWKNRVWSVQVKQPQLQIARAYTPLPPTSEAHTYDDDEPEDLRFLIRQEEGGEVSTYLHRLPWESTIELRGPNTECELPDDIKDVIFLAGGTGIAPAMQVAHALGQRSGSRMHILWANRRREECLGGVSDEAEANIGTQGRSSWWKNLLGLGKHAAQEALVEIQSSQGLGLIVQELEALKVRSRAQTQGLVVQYYVDEEKSFIKPGDVAKRLGQDAPEKNGSKVIFVSGPTGFLDYWAGKKLWVGGQEVQGPLGGVLGHIDLKGWTVYKL